MRQRLWCAIVRCPERAANAARAGFMPNGQELPDWMSWSEYVTRIDGQEVTTGEIVNIPLPYYGPSIPLDPAWSYGGTASPTASTSALPTTTSGPTTPSTSSSTSPSTTSSSQPTTTSLTSNSAPSSTFLTSTAPSASPSSTLPSSSASSFSTSTSRSPSQLSSTLPPSRTSPSPTTRPLSSATSSDPLEPSGSGSLQPAEFNTNGPKLRTILPAVLVPVLVLAVVITLLLWCLKRRRDESEAERTAAFRDSKNRWASVPTDDPSEKLGSGVHSAGDGAVGAAGVARAVTPTNRGPDGAHPQSPVTDEDEVRSGDEHTTLLQDHQRDPGFVAPGMAATGGSIAGLGLLRSLGIGRRESNSSHRSKNSSQSSSVASSIRNVSGNTMEKMVGLVSATSIAKHSVRSSASGGRTSGSKSGGTRSASGETAAKRSSGTSTGAYIPIGDDELFYIVPRASESLSNFNNNDDVYFSASSGPHTGSSGPHTTSSGVHTSSSGDKNPHVRGEHGSLGSSSGSSSNGSRGSTRSGASKASSGRGGGARVSTIPEEGSFMPAVAGAAAGGVLGGIGAAAMHRDTEPERDTPTPSQYDSAGSGSASGRSTGPNRNLEASEFGAAQPVPRRERARDRTGMRFPPNSEIFAGTRRSWGERNTSVGTFGTMDEPRNSIELPSASTARTAAGLSVATSGGSAFGPASSLGTASSHGRPSVPSANSSSLEYPWGAAAQLARSSSSDVPSPGSLASLSTRGRSQSYHDRALPALPSASHASPSKSPYGYPGTLLSPLPSLNRLAPPRLDPSASSTWLAGGDMMLSPFGPSHVSSTSVSIGHISALQMPSRIVPAGASKSVSNLHDKGSDSETEQPEKSQANLYREFGTVQQEASKSAPTLFTRPNMETQNSQSTQGTQDSFGTSGSSQYSYSREEPSLRFVHGQWNPYLSGMSGTSTFMRTPSPSHTAMQSSSDHSDPSMLALTPSATATTSPTIISSGRSPSLIQAGFQRSPGFSESPSFQPVGTPLRRGPRGLFQSTEGALSEESDEEEVVPPARHQVPTPPLPRRGPFAWWR